MNFLQRLFVNKFTAFLAILYIGSLIWWSTLDRTADVTPASNYWYTVLEGVFPILGGIYGIILAKKWGFFYSSVGRAIMFLSLGLLSWGIGEMIFSLYYNLLLKIEVPYPSLADAAFIVSWPLWGIGMVNLSSATGAKYALKGATGKLTLVLFPIIIVVFSYYLLVTIARGGVISSSEGVIKVFFDLAYPIGDVIILTLATLIYGLSFKYFGGKYKIAIYVLLFGFLANYFADFAFSYTTTLETFVPGGMADFLFTLAMFLLAFGVSSLDNRMISSNDK